ncbi:MAG: VTC domain-containing protein [Hymenobacteraceae bacterium]|nr:VTC domain-containing protein [Hymenobacteraceae bacterium]
MRYERKFRLEEHTYEEAWQLIHLHRASFRRTFPDRHINSLYLDTSNFEYFQDNIAGISKRIKQRIRWYGSLVHAQNPVLEIKLKENALGTKKKMKVPDFKLDGSFNYSTFMKNHLWLASTNVTPTVLVRYTRSYFLSFNKRIRLTIDREQCYYSCNNTTRLQLPPVQDKSLIIELKYEQENDADVDSFTQELPFRMTRNSKYVQAMLACYQT